ncbi:MAG: IS1182 family transposase [Terriglobales bacterium]
MPTSFRPCAPDQSLLFPPSPRDWLPEGHLAFFIADTVQALDLRALYARYEGDGRRNAPFDPRMMVTVLLYAYATGTFSSRRMARKLEEDVAYRVLGAGNFPAHRTIAEFRLLHLEAFEDMFVQVVRIAREAGVGRLGKLAVDGTKIKANASKHKAMSYARMQAAEERLRGEIAALLRRAQREDAEEDGRYGAGVRGDELPQELQRREQRLQKIAEAKARLEARQAAADRGQGRTPGDGRRSGGQRRFAREFGVPPDNTQENFTDPDSRIMRSQGGFEQCYNAQAAVAEGSQLIVAQSLGNNASDQGQMVPLVEAAEQAGVAVREVLADAGYRAEASLSELERRRIRAYVALGHEGRSLATGAIAGPATRRLARRLRTRHGSARYRRRKAIVEPVFGWIKNVLGFRRFSLRGLRKVRSEWAMVCLAVNLKRLQRLQTA